MNAMGHTRNTTMRVMFALCAALSLGAVQQTLAEDWILVEELYPTKKNESFDKKLGDFYTPKSATELFAKQSLEKGSIFAYVSNRNWPKLKDFDLSYHFKFHVPEGVKCRETPMFRVAFHAQGKLHHFYYRGYQYTSIGKKVTSQDQLLGHSKIYTPEKDKWYGVRVAVKGRVVKGKYWEVEQGEPERWTLEAQLIDEPKEGLLAIAYRAWDAQKGTEIEFKDIQVKPFGQEKFEYLDPATRPERTTDSPAGRKFVGHKWEYYSAPNCKWPTFEAKTVWSWEKEEAQFRVPEGFKKPSVKDGKLVLDIPAMDSPDKDKVVWINKVFPSSTQGGFSITCSEGVTPLLWYQDKRKNKDKEWTDAPAVFDPHAQSDLATTYFYGTNGVVSYGTNHGLKNAQEYKFQLRFRNGLTLHYGSPTEVMDVLEPTLPNVSWGKEARIGFSAKGKGGTIEITPVELSK